MYKKISNNIASIKFHNSKCYKKKSNIYKYEKFYKIFILVIFCDIIINISLNKKYFNQKNNENNFNIINNKDKLKNDFYKLRPSYQICHTPQNISNKNIVHLLITRFLLTFSRIKIFRENYIKNGIRLMKTYLLPSLEWQLCKNFIWVLTVGNGANITHINYLLNFSYSFKYEIIYHQELKNYIKNKSKGIDILITTRIDYDDRIYYDAVNDVRKAININKPLLLHGYGIGAYYFESNGRYYEYITNYIDKGVLGLFLSLITIIKSVNDSYTIFDMGSHTNVRETLIKNHKIYGLKNLSYEPAIFDSGTPKFVYVRQQYSDNYNGTKHIPKKLNVINFNLSKFYGNC